jgi:hypothetical protein
MTWQWQIHVPADRQFQWGAFLGRMPDSGLQDLEPGRQARQGDYLFLGNEIPAGDYVLTIGLRRHGGKSLALIVRTNESHSTSRIFEADEPSWIGEDWLDCTQAGSYGGTVPVEPGEPLELLFCGEPSKQKGITIGKRKRGAGLLVWLTDAGPPTP